jgi:hypothetical protein
MSVSSVAFSRTSCERQPPVLDSARLLDLRETALGGYVATCLGSQYETGEKTEILLSGSLSALQILGKVPPP